MKILSLLILLGSLLFSAVDLNTATAQELIALKGIGELLCEGALLSLFDYCISTKRSHYQTHSYVHLL